MMIIGNQGAVSLGDRFAVKRYHGNSSIADLQHFRREVDNLYIISQFEGTLNGFQLPVLQSFDESSMEITMTAIDRKKPYIVDFCPMITDRQVFDKFISQVFWLSNVNYFCA